MTGGIFAGLVALTIVMLFGHTHEMNVGWEPPWGILVVTAHFLTLVSAGSCLVVPMLLPRDWALPSEVSQKGLMAAGIAFLGALGVAVVELSQPVRLSFSAELGEGFVGGVYLVLLHSLIYLSCLGATCFSLGRGMRIRARIMASVAFGVVLVILFKSEQMLTLFGFDASWLSVALIPVAAFSAVILGAAVLLLVMTIPHWLGGRICDEAHANLAGRLTVILRVLLVILLIVEALALYGGAAWGGERLALISHLLVSGPLSSGLWFGELLLGVVTPLLLLQINKRPWTLCFAALTVLFGQFMFWYDLILATQLGSLLTLSPLATSGLTPNVVPCLPKMMISLGSISLLLLLISLNEKLQPYRN